MEKLGFSESIVGGIEIGLKTGQVIEGTDRARLLDTRQLTEASKRGEAQLRKVDYSAMLAFLTAETGFELRFRKGLVGLKRQHQWRMLYNPQALSVIFLGYDPSKQEVQVDDAEEVIQLYRNLDHKKDKYGSISEYPNYVVPKTLDLTGVVHNSLGEDRLVSTTYSISDGHLISVDFSAEEEYGDPETPLSAKASESDLITSAMVAAVRPHNRLVTVRGSWSRFLEPPRYVYQVYDIHSRSKHFSANPYPDKWIFINKHYEVKAYSKKYPYVYNETYRQQCLAIPKNIKQR